MTANSILEQLTAQGVNLMRRGTNLVATPKAAVTPEIVGLIRAHKPELLEALSGNELPRNAEVRRQKVLAMLAAHPEARYAVLTDSNSDPTAVIVALAIRGRATCELQIPRNKYDGPPLLDLIERHGGTIH